MNQESDHDEDPMFWIDEEGYIHFITSEQLQESPND